MTNTDTVLGIESRLKEREKIETMASLSIVTRKVRRQLIKISVKIKRIFKQPFDTGVLELKILRATMQSSVTLDEIEQLINKTGKRYAEKGIAIDEMLKRFMREADRINKVKNKPESLIERLVKKFNGPNKRHSKKIATVG
jgi:hypothetical protein